MHCILAIWVALTISAIYIFARKIFCGHLDIQVPDCAFLRGFVIITNNNNILHRERYL